MTIKRYVHVVVNSVPRLAADVRGREWPAHSHAEHTGLDADDHEHYMTNAAGVDRQFTGDVYHQQRIVGTTNLMLDDSYRATHASGGGDWSLAGINLSGAPGEWQSFYDLFGEVSLLAAISAAGASGGNLNDAYHYGAVGTGRTMTADEGAVQVVAPDAAANFCLELLQFNTGSTDVMQVSTSSDGHVLYMTGPGTHSIYAGNDLYLGTSDELLFNDGNNAASSWGANYVPLSDSYQGWSDYKTLYSETGLLESVVLAQYESIRKVGSVGWRTGGTITDGGSQTYDVAAGTGFLRVTTDSSANMRTFSWSASTGNAIADGEVRYVFVNYNGGSPVVTSKTSFSNNYQTEFYVGSVVREGTVLFIQFAPDIAINPIGALHERLRHGGPARVEGLLLSEKGTRNIYVSSGETYYKLTEFFVPTVDTSLTSTVTSYVGTALDSEGVTQWDNQNYDNGGVKTALTTNRWSCLWFYQSTNGDTVYIYGSSNAATQATAEAETPPVTLPKHIQEHGYIIGRYVFQKGASSAASIESAFVDDLGLGGLVGLDDAYRVQSNISADAGAVYITVPNGYTTSALSLSNQMATNTSEVLSVNNVSTEPDAKAAYFYGAAGDGNLVRGHRLWSDGSISLGTNKTVESKVVTPYLTHTYDYTNQITVVEGRSVLGVDIDTTTEAYVRLSGYRSTVGGSDSASAELYSDGQTTVRSSGSSAQVRGASVSLIADSLNISLDSLSGDLRFVDGNHTGSSWSQNYVPLSDDTGDWDDYDTLFGEVSLMGAIVQAAASGGGVSEPDTQLVYGNGTGVDSSSSLVYDYTNQELTVTKTNSETYWYAADAAVLRMTGPASQGMVISSDKDITLGTRMDSATDTPTLQILCQNMDDDGDSNLYIRSFAQGSTTLGNRAAHSALTANAQGGANAEVRISAQTRAETNDGYDCDLTISTDAANEGLLSIIAGGDTYGELILDADDNIKIGYLGSKSVEFVNVTEVDFNDAEITGINETTYTGYTNTLTSNAFTFSFANGVRQRATITANSTMGLTTPTENKKGELIVYNSGASDYTLTLSGTHTVTWLGGSADGVTVPAGDTLLVSILWDTTHDWLIGHIAETV